MKHMRNTTLFYCILSLTLISGCSLDEPNDLAVSCQDATENTSDKVSEIAISRIILDSKECTLNNLNTSECSNYVLNFKKKFCPREYSCVFNESMSQNYMCVRDRENLTYRESNISNGLSSSESLLCSNDDYFVAIENNKDIDTTICQEIKYNYTHNFSPKIFGYCCPKQDVACLTSDGEYCDHGDVCLIYENQDGTHNQCVKLDNLEEQAEELCDTYSHYVFHTDDAQGNLDFWGRCRPIYYNTDYKSNPHIKGYCCINDDTHCGSEDINCKATKKPGWVDAFCESSETESPECVPECAEDYKFEGGECTELKCGDDKHIDHHECVDDTTEQCGVALIDCNSLINQLKSDYQVHGFACVQGKCTLLCSEGYHPDDFNTACVDKCNEMNCGANSHCVSYSTNCIEGEEKYISCDYKTQIDDNNNISIVSQECLDNETIINISTFPIPLDCIEVKDIGGAVYCIKYSYCSKYNYESRCECNSGFVNNLSGDCVSTENCDEDGYITLYHNSNLIKAWCIQSKDDFIQMKDGLKQYDRWPEDNVNNAYYVANDISLGNISIWEPIGTHNNKFKNALFLGNGHIIDGNLTCSQHCGLFGFIDNTIISDINLSLNIQSNLKVTPLTIILNLAYSVGSLVTDAQNSTIKNVSAYGILQSSGLGIGGIIGISRNSSVIDSSFHGTIQGGYASGGIISHIYCSDNKITNITGCHASGYFEADDIGGIIGGNLGKNNCGMAISHSGFSGTLCADKSAGGIVGVSGRDAIISYSSVLDAMIKMKTDATNNNILHGGIAGSGENIQISNSYVLHSTIQGVHSGGLVGSITNPTIKNSYFDGIVRGLYSAGGLVGKATNLVVEECGVFGKIYGTLLEEQDPVSWAGNLFGEAITCFIYNSFSTAHIIEGESASSFGTLDFYDDFYSDITEISYQQDPLSIISNSYSLGDIYASEYFDSDDVYLHGGEEKSVRKGNADNVFIYPKYEHQSTDPANNNGYISGESYMYNNLGYVYFKPNEENQRIPYIGFSKTSNNTNEFTEDDEMINYLNLEDPHPVPFQHLWNYYLCTLSTGPDLNETAEYLIPIPEEFPSIPFCKPYAP